MESAIRLATALLWTSLLLGLLRLLVTIGGMQDEAQVRTATMVLFGALFGGSLLIWKACAGRNWARIALLAQFLAGLAGGAQDAALDFGARPAFAVLVLMQALTQALALALLFFGPGAARFAGAQR